MFIVVDCIAGKVISNLLQLTHGLQYKDNVKGCLLVAVTKEPETRDNLRKIIELLPTLDLTNPRNVLTSDLKVVNMDVGYWEAQQNIHAHIVHLLDN